MNRLFAKIFFWFWLTTIAVVLTTAFTTLHFDRSGADELRQHFKRTQSAHAEAAESILDTQGLAGVGGWLEELHGSGRPDRHFQLLDSAGHPLFGLRPASDVSAVLAQVKGAVAAPPALPDGVFVDLIYSPEGERYWFVSDVRRLRRGGAPLRKLIAGRRGAPGSAVLRLAIAIGVSGLISYALARYLTTPIRRLQAASAEIARGNFQVRIEGDVRRDELGDLGRDFNRMAEQLERLNVSQQQLLRDVSHELRSPLARLQVALGLARQRGGDAVDAELDRIERETEALEDLIGELLSVARLESGLDELKREDVPVDQLIDDVARDAGYEGREQGKSVVIEGESDIVLRGDRVMLKRALENVVRNALRYTSANSTVKLDVIHNPGSGQVRIAVRDHGPGVATEMLGELFKPFVRGDFARDRGSGGHGIGLAIADAAIRRHGGSMSASNHPDGGLCVTILLPRG